MSNQRRNFDVDFSTLFRRQIKNRRIIDVDSTSNLKFQRRKSEESTSKMHAGNTQDSYRPFLKSRRPTQNQPAAGVRAGAIYSAATASWTCGLQSVIRMQNMHHHYKCYGEYTLKTKNPLMNPKFEADILFCFRFCTRRTSSRGTMKWAPYRAPYWDDVCG